MRKPYEFDTLEHDIRELIETSRTH
jgi:hypothetical protein